MKKKQSNPVSEWFGNLKNTKKNFQKIKGSPYAGLIFTQKVRKMIIFPLIIFIIWKGYDIITNYHASGFMNTFGKVIMFLIFSYLIYRIYATIPQAQKQIDYYRKYPHVINYCPTNIKEDIDEILNKVKSNKLNLMEAEKNVQEKKPNNERKTSSRKA